MYKVFIKDKVIFFTKKHTDLDAGFDSVLKLNFFDETYAKGYINLLNNDRKLKAVIISVDDPEEAFNNFAQNLKVIKAAGGVVKNNEGKILFIYRLDKWDLPKGKIEKNEEIEHAAIREVEEECSVTDLKIIKPLSDTFHIYDIDETPILKHTYWFEMFTNFKGKLKPQIEEGIKEVKWMDNLEMKNVALENTYASISDFLKSI